MYRLLLFGGASLEDGSGPITGRASQRGRLALLALLAVEHPRGLSRDALVARLWPESDADRGRHLLRDSVYVLRRTLGDALIVSGEEIRLDPERLSCDLWEFREALEGGDLETAVAVRAGPFLDGTFLSQAEEFERWAAAERARLEHRFAEALEALAERLDTAGEAIAAVRHWRRLTEHDPYNARYRLRLMHALEATGDRPGAMRHADVHAALLRAEFGAEPDPAVAALAARLREPSGLPSERPGADDGERRPALIGYEAGPRAAEGFQAAREAATAARPVIGTYRADERSRLRWLPQRLLGAWRGRLLVLAGVLLLGLLGALLAERPGQRTLALLGIGDAATLLSRGVLAERERILLADFATPTGDTVLASVATAAFRIDLAQSPTLRLVERQQVREALGRMGRSEPRLLDTGLARELAVREGIKAVVTGEVARSGNGFLLTARVIATGSGEILVAHRETARDSTALLPALDRLSKQLRRRIGEPLRSLQANPPLESVTTSSLDALRKYSQAQEVFWNEGDHARAISLLEEAIALDTVFATAHWALVGILAQLAEQPTRRVEMLTRAYRHRHRLPDRERYHLLSYFYVMVAWEPEEAITVTGQLLDAYPDDAFGLSMLGRLYQSMGDYARAEAFGRRALEADSSRTVWLSTLAVYQFNQGKIEEAAATLARFDARSGGHPITAFHEILVAAAIGDHEDAERRAREESSARRGDLLMQAMFTEQLVDLAAVRGRLGEAERQSHEVVRLGVRRGVPGVRLLEIVRFAHLATTARRAPGRVVEAVEVALAHQPLAGIPVYDRPYPELAALYARAGRSERARELLREWEAEAPLDLRRIQYHRPSRLLLGKVRPWALGEVALAEGDAWEAVRQFRRANDESACLICALPHQGRAYEAAAQPDSAIAVYERYLRTPFIYRLYYDAEWLAPLLERLGALHEARGDHARAAEYYRAFVELWQDADAELQPRVREARRRLGALR